MASWVYRLTHWIRDINQSNEYHLDEYVINDGKEHPFAIILPGGGYGMICDHMEGKPVAKYLNSKGISAFVLWYRVKEKAAFPAPMEDLAKAIKYVINNKEKFNLRVEDYSLYGFSAGGHLAAYMGIHYKDFDIPKPYFLSLTYPVIRFDMYTHQGSKNYLIGKYASNEEINRVNIDINVTSDFPKTYLWCGSKDKSVQPINSNLLAEKMKEKGVDFIYRKFTDVGHGIGLGIGTFAEGWIDEAIGFCFNSINNPK